MKSLILTIALLASVDAAAQQRTRSFRAYTGKIYGGAVAVSAPADGIKIGTPTDTPATQTTPTLSSGCQAAYAEAIYQRNQFLFVPSGGGSVGYAGGTECIFLTYLKRESQACHDEYIAKRRAGDLSLFGQVLAQDTAYGSCAIAPVDANGQHNGNGNNFNGITLPDAGAMSATHFRPMYLEDQFKSLILNSASSSVNKAECVRQNQTWVSEATQTGSIERVTSFCVGRQSISSYRHLRCDIDDTGLPTECYSTVDQIQSAVNRSKQVCARMLRPENVAYYTGINAQEVAYCNALLP